MSDTTRFPTFRKVLSPLFRWLSSARFWRRFAFLGACLVTLIALFYTEENLRGKLAWKAYVREQTAKGEPLTLKELIPPPIPDDQNFTFCPLLKPIFDIDWQEGEKGGHIAVWRDTNGLAHLDRWELGTNLTDAPPNQPLTAGVRAALRHLDPDIAALKQAAAERPLDRWPVFYEEQNPAAILLPHLSHIKVLARLCVLRAEAGLASGKTDEAVADWRLGWRAAETLREEPILISLLVRLACHRLLSRALREGFARHQFSAEQLVSLHRSLARADVLKQGVLSLRGERAFDMGIAALARRNPAELTSLMDSPPPPLAAVGFRLMPSGWLYQNQLTLCRMYDRHLLPAIDLAAQRVHPEIAKELEAAILETKGPYGFIARRLMPALSRAIMHIGEGQTLIDQAVLACALERHRLAKGAYPDRLDALVPDFLPKLPHDVITGKPLHYRLDSDGRYRLWSVGWDGQDDGGTPPPAGKRYEESAHQDWVWQLPDPALQPY